MGAQPFAETGSTTGVLQTELVTDGVEPGKPFSRQALNKQRILYKQVSHKPSLNPGGAELEQSQAYELPLAPTLSSKDEVHYQISSHHHVSPPAPNKGGNSPRYYLSKQSGAPHHSDSDSQVTTHETGSADSVSNVSSNESESLWSTSTASSFRGGKRHGMQRLLITHTMGQNPSTALRLIIENGDDIRKPYALDAGTIGKGSFGVVKRAVLKSSGAIRAVKIIAKGGAMKEQIHLLKKEIEIMKILDHPSLLMLYEIFEDTTQLYLVLQMCVGGHLEGYVKKVARLNEVQAGTMMDQILRAVCYLHTHRICHRDMKAENCLLESKAHIERCNLKVADFGLSHKLEPNESFKGCVGTLNHMAPEVLAKKYALPCDLWACGVIAFFLLSGCMPFVGDTDAAIKSKILTTNVQFATVEWIDASQLAMDFISRLIKKNVKTRYSAEQALVHDWMKHVLPKPPSVQLYRQTLTKVIKFRALSKLQRAVLHVMATMLPDFETKTAREFFVMVDANGDGMISMQELRQALGVSALDLQVGDQSDFTYTEFLAATINVKKHILSPVFRATFSSFDKDGDGQLTISEIASGKLLGALSVEEVIEEMEKVDLDGDCSLDFGEFQMMMRNTNL